MPAVSVVDLSGKKVGEIELNDAIFSAPVKEHLLWEVVVGQLAARRKGTASTKGRGEVRGSTAKMGKQKGGGRGRHGSIRAPIYVGGGTVFGPKPRSYEKNVPKKVRRGAMISALSLRASEKKLIVVEDFKLEKIATKRVVEVFSKLGIENGLVVEDFTNTDLVKSVRNLPHSKFLSPEGLNVYDLLDYPNLVLTVSAVKKIEERLS